MASSWIVTSGGDSSARTSARNHKIAGKNSKFGIVSLDPSQLAYRFAGTWSRTQIIRSSVRQEKRFKLSGTVLTVLCRYVMIESWYVPISPYFPPSLPIFVHFFLHIYISHLLVFLHILSSYVSLWNWQLAIIPSTPWLLLPITNATGYWSTWTTGGGCFLLASGSFLPQKRKKQVTKFPHKPFLRGQDALGETIRRSSNWI